MWNGTEWVPNPDAAASAPAPVMVEAAPAQAIIAGNVASMSMPAVQPMGGMPAVATGGFDVRRRTRLYSWI